MKPKKIVTWLVVASLTILGGYWIYKGITKPLPGEVVPDIGREHVTDIAGIAYNSNPPTSGTHFPVWAKPGVYDRLMSDGYLVHSLEHGYVIISYDCTKSISASFGLIPTAFAHDEPTKESTNSGEFLMHMKAAPQGNMSWFTPQNPPEIEVELPESYNSDACKQLVGQLSEFTKVAERVIVVPRVGMDTQIALTAWGRILKLDSVDEVAITSFITTFHNKGPEQTQE